MSGPIESAEKFADHSKRVSISTFPGITVMVYPSTEHPGYWRVKIVSRHPDSEVGPQDTFESSTLFRQQEPPDSATLAQWVREVFIDRITHELEEGLTVDGVRPFEPHPMADS